MKANFEIESLAPPAVMSQSEYEMVFTVLGRPHPKTTEVTEDCIRAILVITVNECKEKYDGIAKHSNFAFRTKILKKHCKDIAPKFEKDPDKMFEIITGGLKDEYNFGAREIWLFEQYLYE